MPREAWIAVAPRFRSVSVLLEMIERARATADEVRRGQEQEQAVADETETRNRQCRLLRGLAIALDNLGRWDDADAVRVALRARDAPLGWWFWTQSWAWHDALDAGDRPRAEARFRSLREAFESGEIAENVLKPTARVALAAGHLRLGDPETASRMLNDLGQPEPVSFAKAGVDHGWRLFHDRFALNRVLGALGDQRPLSEVVPPFPPDAAGQRSHWDEGDALVREFERGVVHLGRLAGLAWAGERLEPSEFEMHARPLVRLFPDHPHLVRGSYLALGARNEFYARLVREAAAHGADCVDALRRMLEAEWCDDTRRDAWPHSLVRAILSELLSAGSPAGWVRTWLARIDPTTLRGDDLETELSDAIVQVRAWAAAGDVRAARATLERTLRATFAVEAKDDQLNRCLEWAVRANRDDPARLPERLAQIAAAILSLDGAKAQGWVAPHLLKAGAAAGARPARALVEWALRNDICRWVDALTILIDELVTRAPAAVGVLSTCCRSLVLPFAQAAEVDLIAHLGSALRVAKDEREYDALAEAIEVVALGSTRPALRQALRGDTEEATHLLRDKSASNPTASGQVVDAFEGLSLTLSELQAYIRSVGPIFDSDRRFCPTPPAVSD